MFWFWVLLRLTLTPVLYLLWWPRIVGTDNVPATGAALLASNHQSIVDHFFTPLPLRRRVFFIGKIDYLTGRGLKGLLNRIFFTCVGIVPVDRTGGKAAEAALTTGLRVLSEGRLLGIYPEGTRAPDTRLYKGKTGVARLALQAQVPVIPVAMTGTFQILPEGRRLPRLGSRPGVRFGEPLDFSRHYDRAADPAVWRAVTDEIMQAIRDLSGQEYVDNYAAEAKSQGTRTGAK